MQEALKITSKTKNFGHNQKPINENMDFEKIVPYLLHLFLRVSDRLEEL